MSTFSIARFRVDVTPPVGHPLCAGWLDPAVGVADQLYASGVILIGAEDPVVLLAIDWCEISNRTYLAWQQEIAEAVGTELTRVAIHAIHAHCLPWPDIEAQRLVEMQEGTRPVMDTAWCGQVIQRIAQAARDAMSDLVPVTHIETGRAVVDKVASNRRIMGENGKVKAVRWTRTYDEAVRAEPEGEIDPWLKTISFWNDEEKLAALHYYAVHPSSYEDCLVSPDFSGLARDRRMTKEPGVLHLYFTECAGDITAGKYNDGARELREVFTERVHKAMCESEQSTRRTALGSWHWCEQPIQLPSREDESPEYLRSILTDLSQTVQQRSRAALALSYHERAEVPITISALHLNDDICILHLPGEAFIEYQHFAQQLRPDAFVVVPSYGDCGPGYICLEKSFEEGGYEPTDSFIVGRSETLLKDAIQQIIQKV